MEEISTHTKPWFLTLFFVALVFSLGGCSSQYSTLGSASTNATAITQLMQIIFIIAGVVFVVVEGLLIYSTLKFRQKRSTALQKEDLPVQTEGNQIFETAWTLAPAVVLAIIFFISVFVLLTIITPPATGTADSASPKPINLLVTGHQWWWQFNYPDLNIETADEFHIPVNTVIMVNVQSADVIHSYWVPQFGGKLDVIPGHLNHTWFKATQTGVFPGQCAQYCGEEHAEMRFLVFVETPENYLAWVKQQQTLPLAMSGEAAKGEAIFNSAGCSGCHTVDGTAAKGKSGPNLTHFTSRQFFSGGILDNTPANVSKWLANPPAVKPGALMPNLKLDADDINSLTTYLENLK